MVEIDREKFGAFVAELRKEKGFTQQDLADRLFVSNKAVSKWERGQGLPDISLLEPLAEVFGVTVTELLRGERLGEKTLDNCEVEELVTMTARLTEAEQADRRARRRFWRLAWVVCALLAAGEVLLFLNLGMSVQELEERVLVVEVLSLIFGGYFCFFAKETIPAFYDQNKLNFYSDGPFRMNLPGVRFNNSNWPHIVRAARASLLAAAVAYPPVFFAARKILPDGGLLALQLIFCLGFLLSMTLAGRRCQ